MILRTPPAKKQKPFQQQQQQLIIYEDDDETLRPDDTIPNPSHSDPMLCTYQCRQMVKSEVLDALSTAEKQARDFETKFHHLNDAFSKAEADSKNLREQLLNAQQELAAAKAREASLQDQLLKESRDFHHRFKSHFLSHSQLEVKLQNEINLRKKAESLAAAAQEKTTLLEGQLPHLSDAADREKKLLHNKLSQLKKDFELSISQKSADLEKMECRAINAEKESELLSEQLCNLKKQLDQCLEQKNEAEKKLATFTYQESTTITDSDILIKHLQEELRNYESEVQEARKLRASHEQIELLKEKLWEERGRREKAESELCKIQELQRHIQNLEDELSSWKSMTEEIPGVSGPDDVPVKFAALQREVIEGTMKVGEVNTLLKQMEVAVDAAQLSKHRAETEAALAKEKAEESLTEINKIQSMLSVMTEERDKLRNHVNELKKLKNDGAGSEAVNVTFMQELESSLATKESCIKELENNLLEYKEVNNRLRNEIKSLNDRLTNEGRRIKSLERESDQLRSEISLLESKLGHGDFSTANTKVLRMVNTLGVDSEAKQTIDALQAELQKTRDRLKAVEELNHQSGDAGKFVDSIISEKIIQLKEQIATLEKREERYKTVFADRISVFRRACCELFGYKIVMDEHQRPNGIPVTHFTLHSIYAQNDNEKLEFDYESGNVTILANDYASQPDISHQIGIFIRKLNSIPAFTANLTVESFNRRTLS